jgi:hypothetical protein
MSPYRIEWREEALAELTNIYLGLRSKSVSRAVQRIDALLGKAPQTSGSYLSEGLYRITEAPLIVYYSIDEDKNLVEVSNVIRITDLLRPS